MNRSNALLAYDICEDDLERVLPVQRQVERFLAGRTDGRVLFERLYGGLDEPVPARLLDIVRGVC